MSTYCVVWGTKFRVYRDRKIVDQGNLIREPGTADDSRKSDVLRLGSEIGHPGGGSAVVLQVLEGRDVKPWNPPKIP